jgi:hypothetical protein
MRNEKMIFWYIVTDIATFELFQYLLEDILSIVCVSNIYLLVYTILWSANSGKNLLLEVFMIQTSIC